MTALRPFVSFRIAIEERGEPVLPTDEVAGGHHEGRVQDSALRSPGHAARHSPSTRSRTKNTGTPSRWTYGYRGDDGSIATVRTAQSFLRTIRASARP